MSEPQADERLNERRAIAVRVYGANADALEMAALDEARQFFGSDVHLEVARRYTVGSDPHAEPERRYSSTVLVREV